VGRRGGVGGVSSPRKRPRESVGRGAGAPPGSTSTRIKKHYLPYNALDQDSATWTAGLRTGECFPVHYVTFFGQGGLRFLSRKQFLSILRECRGAPLSKMRISFLFYIGSFAVWMGVEYGLVHAISPCTGGVRRQFENCGSRPQYRKSACAPLSRRSASDAKSLFHWLRGRCMPMKRMKRVQFLREAPQYSAAPHKVLREEGPADLLREWHSPVAPHF